MGNELVVDLHELFVDLLVIFGIFVPEQRYNLGKRWALFLPLDYTCCICPCSQGCLEVSLPIVESREVGVRIDVLVPIVPSSNFNSFVVELLTCRAPCGPGDLFKVAKIAQSHGVVVKMAEVVEKPKKLLLEHSHLKTAHDRGDRRVDAGDEGGHLHVPRADHRVAANVEPRVSDPLQVYGQAALVLVAPPVPGHLMMIYIL